MGGIEELRVRLKAAEDLAFKEQRRREEAEEPGEGGGVGIAPANAIPRTKRKCRFTPA